MSSDKLPLVSIIMAAYNAEAYISEAIYSIHQQTYSNWELLIINDGSSDQTERKVKAFCDSRIRYFKQENKGVSSARNLGLSHIKGDFFCFLDSDDVYPSKSIEKRIEVFLQNPNISFVDGQVLVMDQHLKKTLFKKEHTFKGNPFECLLRLDERCFFGPSWMIRRQKGIKYQFEEGLTHGEDLLFYLFISKRGGEYTSVEYPVLKYRKGNISAMTDLKGLERGYLELYNCLKNELKVNIESLQFFRRKIRSIMFKSYLKSLSPFKALFSYIRFSSI